MNLVLEVMSQNTQGLVGSRRKVFGVGGGSIGRAPECDWVLPSPYVSRHHATVCCIDGVFYIESTGENGVAVNAPQSMLPQLERRALKAGDRLFIDEFEISVRLSSGAVLDESPAANPFMSLPPPAVEAHSESGDDNLDPLKGLAGGSSLNTAPRHEPAWNHSSSLADHFTPPPIAPLAPAAPSAMPIAEDWNQTEFKKPVDAAPAKQPSPPAGAQSSPAMAPWFTPVESQSSASAAPGSTSAAAESPSAFAPKSAPVPAPPIGQHASASTAPRAGAWPAPTQSEQPIGRAFVPSQHEQSAVRSFTPAQSDQPAARDFTAANESAPDELDPVAALAPKGRPWSTAATMSASAPTNGPAAMALPQTDPNFPLDLIMRNMVQGLIEVLRERAEFRNQFRLPVTRVRTAENNPLKFAINADDAMDSLMSRRNPGYLPAAEAFEDAFNDIRFHQLAMVAGMRAGFECVMSRFDPQKLQERFDRQLKHTGFLAVASKLRYWDLYSDWFEELAGDADGAFQRLFGEEFASAYERQLEALKRSRGNPHH